MLRPLHAQQMLLLLPLLQLLRLHLWSCCSWRCCCLLTLRNEMWLQPPGATLLLPLLLLQLTTR
jgi:hypothetical protein